MEHQMLKGGKERMRGRLAMSYDRQVRSARSDQSHLLLTKIHAALAIASINGQERLSIPYRKHVVALNSNR